MVLLMCLRGSVCLYQGEELGLPEAELAFEDLQDPYGIEFWPEFKGRDGCRTPMVWSTDNRLGGFSTADKSWLPVPAQHLSRSAAAQGADDLSMLAHYRRALAFRRSEPALRAGGMSLPQAKGDLVTFTRNDAGRKIFCAFNLGEGTVRVEMPGGAWAPLGQDLGGANIGAELGAWGFLLAATEQV